MMASYDAKNPAALRRLAAAGAQLRPFSPEIMDASYQAALKIYGELSAANATFKKVYDQQLAFKKDAYLWAQFSELSYDQFMMTQQRNNKL